MKLALLGALVSIAAWILLAFVWAFPSGWVHVPLAVGAVLLAVAIIESDKRET